MMRKRAGASRTSGAALLLSSGIRLLVRHGRDRPPRLCALDPVASVERADDRSQRSDARERLGARGAEGHAVSARFAPGTTLRQSRAMVVAVTQNAATV